MVCPGTSVWNYRSTLCNIPEQRISHQFWCYKKCYKNILHHNGHGC